MMINRVLMGTLALMTGCAMIDGSGDVIEQTRDLSGFDAISLQGSITVDVAVTEDAASAGVLRCDRNLVEHIETTVRQGELIVKSTRNTILRPTECVLLLTVPRLASLRVPGSGELYADNASDLETATLSGSGELVARGVDSARLDAKVTGSGLLKLSGVTDVFSAKNTGSGFLNARDLEAQRATLKLSGSGDAAITALERVEVDVNGSGSAHIYGSPSNVKKDRSGSGQIIFH